MMAVQNYRSEDEQISSLLDETQGKYPFLKSEDPVIFYNAEYERELLMSYNLDFGESCSAQGMNTSFEEPKPQIEPRWPSPSETEHQPSPKYAPSTMRFNPYSSGPIYKEPQVSRRGRPSKTTSDSKMANYARNYREAKKNELSSALVRMEELEEELRLVREENKKMQSALRDANAEVAQLRKVIDQDSQIANVVARMSDRVMDSVPMGSSNGAGVCVHYGTRGTTVEVCKMCADNSQQRLHTKTKLEDIDPTLQLFNGDFSSIEQFLN